MHSTRPLVRLLVRMEYHSFHWYSIGEFHFIMGALIISVVDQAGRGCILLVHWYDWCDCYKWNIIHTIGIPLVNCISLWGLRIFLWAHQAGREFILLVHWYDWYEWNIIHSIGTLSERRIHIVFSVCLGSRSLRTKNIHRV